MKNDKFLFYNGGNAMPRLFLLEDDASLAEGLAWALGKQGFEVSCAATLA